MIMVMMIMVMMIMITMVMINTLRMIMMPFMGRMTTMLTTRASTKKITTMTSQVCSILNMRITMGGTGGLTAVPHMPHYHCVRMHIRWSPHLIWLNDQFIRSTVLNSTSLTVLSQWLVD